MRPLSRTLAFLAAACITLSVATPALPQTKKEKKQAKVLYKKGLKLYKKGSHEDALALFLEAHEIVPKTGNLYNIARCLHKLDRLKEAVEYYEEYIAQDGPKKEKAGAFVDVIKNTPSKLSVDTNPPGADVFLDDAWEPAGKSPLIMDVPPGKHRISVRLEGYQEGSRLVVISYADTYSYTINLTEEKPVEPEPVAPEEDPVEEHKQRLERSASLSNLLLGGGGFAVPIALDELVPAGDVSITWELFLPRSFSIGVGLDIQISVRGQLYTPHAFAGYTIQLPLEFQIYFHAGVGAAAANMKSRYMADPDGTHADLVIVLDAGLGWSRKGFTIRIDAAPFYVIPGIGGITKGASALYIPRILLGYHFAPPSKS